MQPFYLVQTITQDKLIHQGMFFKPDKPTKKALLWIHGITGNFYQNIGIFDALSDICNQKGFGFASFNTRGHDQITGFRKIDANEPRGYTHVYIGAGYEKFSDCIYDIEAGIDFLTKQGFLEIIVAGHSTGANKACYYGGSEKNNHVTGIVLVSPVSDRLDKNINKSKITKDLSLMQDLVNRGKGNNLITGFTFFPITPYRFLSLYKPHSKEDTFDYGDTRPRLTYFSRITKPLLVVLGQKDEYLDRPAKKIIEVFDKFQHSENYKSIIIPNALHGFDGKEKDMAKIIIEWAKNL